MTKDDNKQKKTGFFDNFLWWKIDPEEIAFQVKNYQELSIMKSARGQAFLAALFSVAVTFIFVLFLEFDSSMLWDAAILFILGVFMYLGHRWAMIGGMLLWTLEKAYSLIDRPSGAFITLLWWALFMRFFYLAFKVESQRIKAKKAEKVKPTLGIVELEKLAELRDKGVITKEDFDKKKSEILGV